MAQNVTTIVLKTTGEQDEFSDQEYLGTGEQTNNQEKLAASRKQLAKTAVIDAGLWAAQEITSVIAYDVNLYTSLTENYKLQTKMDNVGTTISKTTSFLSSVISGATTGASIGGGWGALAGAALAVVKTVVTEGIEITKNLASQNVTFATSDMQSSYSQSRLGLIDNGRNTQN